MENTNKERAPPSSPTQSQVQVDRSTAVGGIEKKGDDKHGGGFNLHQFQLVHKSRKEHVDKCKLGQAGVLVRGSGRCPS